MKMKKLVSILLTAACVLSMTACGGKDTGSKEPVTAKIIDIKLTEEEYAFGVDKNQPELLEATNTFIAQIKEDGRFDEICDNYFGNGTPEAVVSAELDETKDQLVVATNAEFAPFEYKEGENYYGIDMEIAKLLAEELDKELVIVNMDFDAVCLQVQQGKCDIAMAGLTVTEERKEAVNFTDAYYEASQKLVVISDNTEFDACTDAASVEAILKEKDSTLKAGFQTGTTGQYYCEGDTDWGFEGFAITAQGYKNAALAVQDLLNGNLEYVFVDEAPAKAITEAINSVQ